MDDITYLNLALEEANKPNPSGEIPIGCVLVNEEDNIVIVARNRVQEIHDNTAHAEMEAIHEYCRRTGRTHLYGCKIYVTLEPCPMCADALISGRISTVIYGAKNTRMGGFGGLFNLLDYPLECKPEIKQLPEFEDECLAPIRNFFKERRNLPKYKRGT